MRAYRLAIMLVLVASPAFAADLVTLDAPGATGTTPNDINEAGDVVGTFSTADGRTHGFLWSRGVFTTIDAPGADSTELWAVNNRGDIVGITDFSTMARGFLLRNGVFTALLGPDGEFLLPRDINNRGDIVGSFSATFPTGFLLDARGTFTRIEPQLPSKRTISWVQGIDDGGTMVGVWFDVTEFNGHGFVLDNGDTTTFALAFSTFPLGINNAGVIVGAFGLSYNLNQAFVLHAGTATVISIPGASSETACGVNNRGDIVGTYFDGVSGHGFVLRN